MQVESTSKRLVLTATDEQDIEGLTAIQAAMCKGEAILVRVPGAEIVIRGHERAK